MSEHELTPNYPSLTCIQSKILKCINKLPVLQKSDALYLGPDFSSLNEEIQEGLGQYLIECGLDQETAAFIELMSLDKEQRLYLKWLQEVKSFVSSNKVL